MNHRRSHVHSLLAGRCRTTRRPPPATTATTQQNHLRLSQAGSPADLSDDRRRASSQEAQLARAERTAIAARAALKNLARIVCRLDASLSAAGDDNRSARSSAAEQDQIESLIDAAEAATALELDDAPPLSAGVLLSAQSAGGPKPKSPSLPPIRSDTLGSEEVGGFLSSLRRGRPNAPSAFGVGPARAIVRTAAFQLQAHCDAIESFLGAIADARAESEVAAANLASADSLMNDPAFLSAAAMLTPIDAMTAAPTAGGPAAPQSARSVLRLRRPPPSDKSGG